MLPQLLKCQTDATSVKWLAKDVQIGHHNLESRKIVCTGETMKDAVIEAFSALSMTSFRPQHTARLDNRYACFADFELQA